jgi:hypothetical protein
MKIRRELRHVRAVGQYMLTGKILDCICGVQWETYSTYTIRYHNTVLFDLQNLFSLRLTDQCVT